MVGKRVVAKRRPPITRDSNKAIAQHFQSKKEQHTTVKHYPEWDEVGGEPRLGLARLRRELIAADADLAIRHKEYVSRRELAEQQWQELRTKYEYLRASFVQFDEFVRENREKRERAERKIASERERQRIRLAEIVDLERGLDQLEGARDKMRRYAERYLPFQAYLETVLGNKEFHSIAGVFNRYDTLLAARQSLELRQDRHLQTLETTSTQLQKMTEEKSQNLMDLNSRLAQLQSRHERARAEALHWEAMVNKVKEASARKELEESQVRACIWNLYQQICRRKELPVEASRDDLERQLKHIKSTISELGKIVRAAKRKSERERKLKEIGFRQDQAHHANAGQNGQSTVTPRQPSRRESGLSTYDDVRSLARN